MTTQFDRWWNERIKDSSGPSTTQDTLKALFANAFSAGLRAAAEHLKEMADDAFEDAECDALNDAYMEIASLADEVEPK